MKTAVVLKCGELTVWPPFGQDCTVVQVWGALLPSHSSQQLVRGLVQILFKFDDPIVRFRPTQQYILSTLVIALHTWVAPPKLERTSFGLRAFIVLIMRASWFWSSVI